MRVVHLVMNDVRNDHRVAKETSTLARAGHEVHVIGVARPPLPAREDSGPVRISRVPARPWPTRKARFAEYAARAAGRAARLRPHVVHANDLDTLLPGWIAARACGARLVYDAHELYLESEHLLGRERERRLWEWIERRLAPRADAVITVCGSIARELESRYGLAGVSVLRNVPRYDGESAAAELVPDRSPERPVLLHQGYLQRGRGLDTLVDAMKHLPGARLVFLGEGPEEGPLRARALAAGVGERVLFRAPVPLEQLLAHTRGADLGLVLYEGRSLNYTYALPNKLFETIMAGVPVLASDLPEIRAIVAPRGVGRLVAAPTPETVAETARAMLADREGLEAMRARCREAARELCWEREEAALLAVYERLGPPRAA